MNPDDSSKDPSAPNETARGDAFHIDADALGRKLLLELGLLTEPAQNTGEAWEDWEEEEGGTA